MIAVSTCLMMVVSALLYNLIAMMKGDIHLGLVEIEVPGTMAPATS